MDFLFHASKTRGIAVLRPMVSNHGIARIYFSCKRENVLVYLSNAVEKYCKETGFAYHGIWYKWASYGFDKEGKMQIEEYYPNALYDTYKGVGGYLYMVGRTECAEPLQGIKDAYILSEPTEVCSCEFVEDAYDAIIEAEKQGLISVVRYENLSKKQMEWLEKTIQKEYDNSIDHPEYRYFLENKFGNILIRTGAIG